MTALAVVLLVAALVYLASHRMRTECADLLVVDEPDDLPGSALLFCRVVFAFAGVAIGLAAYGLLVILGAHP